MFDQHLPSVFYLSNDTHYQTFVHPGLIFLVILNSSCRNTEFFIFYRSNDNSSVTGVTIIIIIVAILFGFVLVLVLVVFYKWNQFGFRDKVQQLIRSMYWLDAFCTVIVLKYLNRKCFIVKMYSGISIQSDGITYIWIFWIVYKGIFNLE